MRFLDSVVAKSHNATSAKVLFSQCYNAARKLFLHSLGHPKRVTKAHAMIKLALQLRPKDYDALMLCANIASEVRGRRSESLRCFDRAMLLRPGSPDPCDEKANVLLGWGRPLEAVRWGARALAIAERRGIRGNRLAYIYDALISSLVEGKRIKSAARLLRRALRSTKSDLIQSLVLRYARQWKANNITFPEAKR